jgi:histidinol phosphatase-like PHP family hydrolase
MSEDEVNEAMAHTIEEYATTEHARLAEVYRMNPILQSSGSGARKLTGCVSNEKVH